MHDYGLTSLHEYLGDQVLFRNLEPANPDLPGLKILAPRAGLPPGRIPRKTEEDYARVIVELLKEAQQQRGISRPIQRILFIGDTRLLDGTAFGNLCLAGGWPGLAFIGSENNKPASVEVVTHESGQPIYLANRWSALEAFREYATRQGFAADEATAAIVDIDKTALGARGRNAQVIDRARVVAVQDTVAALLGDSFDLEAFRSAYDLLNQPEFHSFTADNQDYLAYICLILGSGIQRLDTLLDALRRGEMNSFLQFIRQVDERQDTLPANLADIHGEIYTFVQAGDPTPFKAFRRNEYLRTIRCFNSLGEDATLEQRLEQEMLVTQEVRQTALVWKETGALLLGLSDKPDEAATPTPQQAAQGWQPIHRAQTHAVGA